MAFDINLAENDGYGVPADTIGREVIMRREVDFSVAANQLASTKIMALFHVPAGVLIEEVLMRVKTVDADVTDVDLGSFTTAAVAIAADMFVDGASLASAGVVRDLAGETYSRQDGTAGYSSTANWIIALTNNDADTINQAVVVFFAVGKDLR